MRRFRKPPGLGRAEVKMHRYPQSRRSKNDYPLSSTLVEEEVTHPFIRLLLQSSCPENCPTCQLIGDSRWCRSMRCKRRMFYRQCHSRSLYHPVSLHPAVYYTQLAGNRASLTRLFNVIAAEGHRCHLAAIAMTILIIVLSQTLEFTGFNITISVPVLKPTKCARRHLRSEIPKVKVQRGLLTAVGSSG
ncbi:Protein argonaute [Fusarium poae]